MLNIKKLIFVVLNASGLNKLKFKLKKYVQDIRNFSVTPGEESREVLDHLVQISLRCQHLKLRCVSHKCDHKCIF